MTQEEKAKRYDEAFERARAFNNGEDSNIEVGTTLCEYIFPELKESEDERIRKKLIEAVKGDMVIGGAKDKQRAIAWLEKQGKKPQGKSALEAINEEKIENKKLYKIY